MKKITEYLADSYAWIEYLDGTEKGKILDNLLKDERNIIFTSALTITEVISKAKRKGKNIDIAFNSIVFNSKVIGINHEYAKDAGLVHAEMKQKNNNFGLGDSFILTAARKINAKIITGDKHFKGLKEAIII